jgi:hypothetical protein
MNRIEANAMAKKMVKKGCSVYASNYTVSRFNGGKLLTEHALSKVLKAFYQLVKSSHRYTVVQQLYAEEQLANT